MTRELSVEFGKILQSPTIFPDEQGKLEVTVTNEGNRKIKGAIVNLYASTDAELDDEVLNTNEDKLEGTNINALQGTDELLGTIDGINLAPDRSLTFTVDFASSQFRTPSGVSPGAYNLIAEVDPNNTIAETDETNNEAIQFVSSDGTDAVLDWNSVFLNAVQTKGKIDLLDGVELDDSTTTATMPGTPPPLEAGNAAILHLAIYDAVNALSEEPHAAYLTDLPDPPERASQEAAAVGAAYRVLSELYPAQQATFDKQRDRSLAEISDNPAAEQAGFDFGVEVAEQILAFRSSDGADKAQIPYKPENKPGNYQETTEYGKVSALFAKWGEVTPFAIDDVASFHPSGPPEFGSDAYAENLEQVQSLGGLKDTEITDVTRSEEQTEIAQFWSYDRIDSFRPPGQWNEIAQEVALDQGNSLEENARLFALLNTAMADAGIVAWNTKYTYEQLRPVEAIRGADNDNNPNTTGDLEWEPLLETPPFPDYISGHSTFGGAAADVLEKFFGENVSLEIPSQELPGISRLYTGSEDMSSFEQAAIDNINSRVYGGIHVPISTIDGLNTGMNIADFVWDNFLV